MYQNRQFRECRNGLACYFLQNGACWFYHPSWHFDSEYQYENQFVYNSPMSNWHQSERFQSNVPPLQQVEQAQDHFVSSSLIGQLHLVKKYNQQKDEADLSWLEQEEESEISKIELNGREVELIRVSSKVSGLKKWYFERSYHFNYFEGFSHKDCPICLCHFEAQNIVTLLFCNHGFHKECIQKWVITSDKCPLCRKDFTAQEQFKKMKGYKQQRGLFNPIYSLSIADFGDYQDDDLGNEQDYIDIGNLQVDISL